MAYQITYRGLTVTCNDANEVDQLADRIERKRPASPSSFLDAVSKIGVSGKQLLRVVSEQQTPISQSNLARQMNLSAAQLPGPITAISKRMKDAGFKLADVLTTAPNGNGGERMFSLVPSTREEVRIGLGK
jgi:hypothetical protein